MTHHEALIFRDTSDQRDRAPACNGQLLYIGWHDLGDADWELFQCSGCRQYIFRDSARSRGDLWAGITSEDEVARLEQQKRIMRKAYPR